MYTYIFEWKHGDGVSLISKMIARWTNAKTNTHSDRAIIDWDKHPQVIVRDSFELVTISGMPITHVQAVVTEIDAERARLSEQLSERLIGD